MKANTLQEYNKKIWEMEMSLLHKKLDIILKEIVKMSNQPHAKLTPTTLRETLFELASTEYHNGRKSARGKDVETAFVAIDQATQSIQEQLKALLPEKEHQFNGKNQDGADITGVICYCKTVLEIEGTDFPRRVSHKDCSAVKAIDQIEKAIEEWAK